ncbi:MAG TPA: hypothetical protein ENH94_04230 [Phycisphaerales bacterium]|nr:hypothetical protein [Phycisphaerales bacterium]
MNSDGMDWRVTTEPTVEPVTLHEMRQHSRIDSGTEIQLDFGGVAVDETGGISSLPAAAHGLSVSGGTRIVVSGTTNYDGVHVTTSETTTEKIAFVATYVAETMGTTEFVHTGGDNELILSLIIAARQYCEMFSRRAYITQTITGKLDRFANPPFHFRNMIILPNPNLQTVSSVKYIDTEGVQQTLDASVYDVDATSTPGRITLAYSQSWPSLRGEHHAVEIIFVTGYGDAATDVPSRIIQAIKLLAGEWYREREATGVVNLNEIPNGVNSLLSTDRVF